MGKCGAIAPMGGAAQVPADQDPVLAIGQFGISLVGFRAVYGAKRPVPISAKSMRNHQQRKKLLWIVFVRHRKLESDVVPGVQFFIENPRFLADRDAH